MSALVRWPCSISIHLSRRSVTAGVRRPFPLAMQHVYSFVSQVCHWWCLHGQRNRADAASDRPGRQMNRNATCPAEQGGHSFVSQVCHWWCPPCSAGHVAFLFICLPGLSLLVSALFFRWPRSISIHFICLPGLSLLASALFRWPCSI